MNAEQKSAYNKAYRVANWDRILERRKKWYAANADRERNRSKKYAAALSKDVKHGRQRRYREANRDKLSAYTRKRYKEKRAAILLYNKQRRAERPEVEQDWYLRTEYGISLAEYNALRTKQKGLCAICRKSQKKRLSVDHCHTTGRVRGLLCDRCNHGLGHFKDEIAFLQRAIKYLAEHVA